MVDVKVIYLRSLSVLDPVWVKLAKDIHETPVHRLLEGVPRVDVKIDIMVAPVWMIDVDGLRSNVQVTYPERPAFEDRDRSQNIPESA